MSSFFFPALALAVGCIVGGTVVGWFMASTKPRELNYNHQTDAYDPPPFDDALPLSKADEERAQHARILADYNKHNG